VLVEGYWSVFRLHALGVLVVGLMGWSVAPEHFALLRERGTRYVTLLLDGDDAGRKARERAFACARGRVLRPRAAPIRQREAPRCRSARCVSWLSRLEAMIVGIMPRFAASP
jgi:hypothetical protein